MTVQTNFRAEDMPGAAKPVVVAAPVKAAKPEPVKKVAPTPAPVVEEPVAVVEEVASADEE